MQRIPYFTWVDCLRKYLNLGPTTSTKRPAGTCLGSLPIHAPRFSSWGNQHREEWEEGCSWVSFQHTLRSWKVLPVPTIFLFPWCPSLFWHYFSVPLTLISHSNHFKTHIISDLLTKSLFLPCCFPSVGLGTKLGHPMIKSVWSSVGSPFHSGCKFCALSPRRLFELRLWCTCTTCTEQPLDESPSCGAQIAAVGVSWMRVMELSTCLEYFAVVMCSFHKSPIQDHCYSLFFPFFLMRREILCGLFH